MRTNPPLRWAGALAGLLLAALDTWVARLIGMTFELNGRDATNWVWLYVGVSFAGFGYVVGWLVEVRRREAAASSLARERDEALARTRTRLAENERLAALGQLSSAIAHEVCNPLAIIRSSVQNLAETLAEAETEGRESCRFITEEIDRLTKVTASVLDFSRKPRWSPRLVSLSELLERTAHGDVPSAVAAMRDGAFHYITKPFDNDELRGLVARALELTRLEREVDVRVVAATALGTDRTTLYRLMKRPSLECLPCIR